MSQLQRKLNHEVSLAATMTTGEVLLYAANMIFDKVDSEMTVGSLRFVHCSNSVSSALPSLLVYCRALI